MSEGFDFKKEWPKIKKELTKLSTEAVKLAKKGEKEVVKYSRLGKLQVDVATLGLKKEHLYHLVGKEYIKAGCPAAPTAKLKQWVEEAKTLDKNISDLKGELKKGAAKKRAAVKKVAVKAKKPAGEKNA